MAFRTLRADNQFLTSLQSTKLLTVSSIPFELFECESSVRLSIEAPDELKKVPSAITRPPPALILTCWVPDSIEHWVPPTFDDDPLVPLRVLLRSLPAWEPPQEESGRRAEAIRFRSWGISAKGTRPSKLSRSGLWRGWPGWIAGRALVTCDALFDEVVLESLKKNNYKDRFSSAVNKIVRSKVNWE